MSNPYSIFPTGWYNIEDGQSGIIADFAHDTLNPESTKASFYLPGNLGSRILLKPREEPYIIQGKEYVITENSTIADIMPRTYRLQVARHTYKGPRPDAPLIKYGA